MSQRQDDTLMLRLFARNARKWLIRWLVRIAILAALLGAIAIFAKLYPFNGVGEWTGIGKDSNKSVTTEQEINPQTKQVIKITTKETENFQSSKTLWDWLQLGGTIAIPFVLLYFERTQQRRSQEQAETEKKIADNNLREQALEAYFDRMSELLIDKELKLLISKNLEESTLEYQKLDTALDIARARTLSILRRLGQDKERIKSVLEFLSDAQLIDKPILLSANLSNIDLSYADLGNANLRYANLSNTNLSNTNLTYADLTSADFSNADLSNAYLSYANLTSAKFRNTNLTNTNLIDADLMDADLRDAKNLTSDQVKKAVHWDCLKYDQQF